MILFFQYTCYTLAKLTHSHEDAAIPGRSAAHTAPVFLAMPIHRLILVTLFDLCSHHTVSGPWSWSEKVNEVRIAFYEALISWN